MSKTFTAKNLAYCGIFVALLSVSGIFTIPLTNGALSLQVAVVFILACILERRLAVLTVIAYLILGLVGLPVFAKGGGFGYVLQPTFGFLASFVFGAFALSTIYQSSKFSKKVVAYVVGIIVTLFIVYTLGTTYMYFLFKLTTDNPFSFAKIISFAVTPYILVDIGKAVIAYFIIIALEKALRINQ